jgi:hypothetical protein
LKEIILSYRLCPASKAVAVDFHRPFSVTNLLLGASFLLPMFWCPNAVG